MSRRKKRRGRGTPADERNATEESQGSDIEIVDDLGVLGDEGVAADARAASAAPDAAAAQRGASTRPGHVTPDVPLQAEAASDGAAVPRDPAETSAQADAPQESPSVHVVDPLHDTPHAPVGERNVETLGELLQHAREAKGLSLEEVSARTRIALPTLRHLENDRFGELPAEAYVKGFLRSYGGFLTLDVAMLLRRYEKLSGHAVTPVAEIWEEIEVNPSRLRLWTPSRRTVALTSAVAVLAALAWVFWSQGAVMLGLRPEGELQQIEMQLQRESRDGNASPAPITGLDDAALQQESAVPTATQTPTAVKPAEDTAPTVPVPPPAVEEPKPTDAPASQRPAAAPDADKPAADAAKPTTAKPADKPVQPAARPAAKPVEKPKKKAPAPSPEDAAGPPG